MRSRCSFCPKMAPGQVPGFMTCTWFPHYLRLSHIQPPALSRHHASSARLRCHHFLWTNGLPLHDLGDWEESVVYLRRTPGLCEGFPFLHCNVKCSWINLLEGQRGVASFLLVGVDATTFEVKTNKITNKIFWKMLHILNPESRLRKCHTYKT